MDSNEAARSEAWQWLGWAESILSYEDVQMRYEGYPDLDDTPFGVDWSAFAPTPRRSRRQRRAAETRNGRGGQARSFGAWGIT